MNWLLFRSRLSGSTFTVQWFFSEEWTVKFRFFLNRLSGLSTDNGSWLWVETVNPEPDNLGSYVCLSGMPQSVKTSQETTEYKSLYKNI